MTWPIEQKIAPIKTKKRICRAWSKNMVNNIFIVLENFVLHCYMLVQYWAIFWNKIISVRPNERASDDL